MNQNQQMQKLMTNSFDRKGVQQLWYTLFALQHYWIKILKHRETAYLSPSWQNQPSVRMKKNHNTQQWQTNLEYTGIKNCSQFRNIYYSLAKFKSSFPLFRKEQEKEKEEYKENIWKDFESFDMVLDIDCPSHELMQLAFDDMKIIHNLLAYQKVAHYIRFSGKGFHIFFKNPIRAINQEYFNPESEVNIYKEYAKIAREYYKLTELIDLTIYDHRRIIKLPYSLVHYQFKTYVCHPMQKEEVEADNFLLERYEVFKYLSYFPDFPDNILGDYIFEYDN